MCIIIFSFAQACSDMCLGESDLKHPEDKVKFNGKRFFFFFFVFVGLNLAREITMTCIIYMFNIRETI